MRTSRLPGGRPPEPPGARPIEGRDRVRRALAQPDARFCLVFRRESTSVPAMRQVLGDTLRRLGVNEDSVADILLAASEACTNVIRHAARSVAEYAVAATVDSVHCRVEVIDSGEVARRPPRQRVAPESESGRGFEVMRACVDDVQLRSAPGHGTVVTLDKKLTR